MNAARQRALILGCHGGVGRAVVALLERSGAGCRLRERLDGVLLVDRTRGETQSKDAALLPPVAIASAMDLISLVDQHHVTQVIDLSSIDTVDCTRACDERGVHFLCTSVEEWPGQGSIPTNEAIARLLPPRRPLLTRRSHLVGSGANPGMVNALVFAALEAFSRRTGVQPTVAALDLHAVLITEDDTTTAAGDAESDDIFPMTWSPFHCLEELFEPTAFAARRGQVASLGHRPTQRGYRARCGDRVITGMAVPHEEIATLAARLPEVEIAFIYRIPPAARLALKTHPERQSAEAWTLRKLYPPWTTDIRGQDRVGVLLCSRRFGEFWMGFETDVAAGLALGTNATQLQVGAGVLAGWTQLGRRTGIHFVEDLDWREFLDVAGELLGPVVSFHDPGASPRSLAQRRTELHGTAPWPMPDAAKNNGTIRTG